MNRPRQSAFSDFDNHLNDALEAAAGSDPEAAMASAEKLAQSLKAVEDWRRQLSPDAPPDAASAEALRELQRKAYRLARTLGHAAWVRQGLREIAGNPAALCYERDGRVQASGQVRLAVDG